MYDARGPARPRSDAETTRIGKCVEDGFLFETFSSPMPNVASIQIQAGVSIDHRINCIPNPVFTDLPIRCLSVRNVAALPLRILAVPGLHHNRLDPGQPR